MKKKTWKIVVGIFLLLLVSGGLYAYKEFTRKVKDLTHVKAGVSIDAGKLVSEFEANEAEGNSKYLDQVIAVRGKVKTVEKNGQGYFTVILGEENSMSSVRCSMDSVHQQDVASLASGTIITMKGSCTGFNKDELLGSDVILNRCVVEN
jgi:hypothetical protein